MKPNDDLKKIEPMQSTAKHGHVAECLKRSHDIQEMDDIAVEEILRLVQKPFKAIGSVVSKEQALDLAKQMLIKNLALQNEVNQLRIKNHRLSKGQE